MTLPLATFEKILKESGKDIRVSKKAAEEMIKVVEEVSRQLAGDALELARHANRKTILEQDVELAYKKRRVSL